MGLDGFLKIKLDSAVGQKKHDTLYIWSWKQIGTRNVFKKELITCGISPDLSKNIEMDKKRKIIFF